MEDAHRDGEDDDATDGNAIYNAVKRTVTRNFRVTNPTQIIRKDGFKLTPYYKIRKSKPAFALIFSHNTFLDPKRKQRKCTAADCMTLTKLLDYMHIEHEFFYNKTSEEIEEIVKNCERFNFKKYSSLLVIVSTHGNGNGQVFAKDKSYDLYDILYSNFTNSKCPELKGKPRIFLIQACQGDDVDYGVTVHSKSTVQSDSYFPRGPHANLPQDFLVAYSTVDGHYSFQNKNGSWFINAIYDEFLENCYSKDLISCLTSVSRVIATEKKSSTSELKTNDLKQNVCIVYNMDKLLKFKKKA